MNGLDFVSILVIALGLSADCFAVAFGGSFALKKLSWQSLLRVSLTFGLFQAGMPAIGWAFGQIFADRIAVYAPWVAFGLLAFIGGRMLWGFFREKADMAKAVDITRGTRLLLLAFATSIDAMAAGLSFAFLEVNIIAATITIGVVTLFITAAGMVAGRKAGRFLGRWAEFAGGVILIGIGLRILITGLLS